MTYQNAFGNIKEKLSSVKSEKFTRDFAIQINITNKDCAGAFYVANLEGVFYVEPYDYRDNSAMVTLMMGDFTKLVEGKLNIEKAIESGKLQVVGDLEAVAQISGIVESEKKAAPKKEASKKEEPKKAEPKKTQAKKSAAKKTK